MTGEAGRFATAWRVAKERPGGGHDPKGEHLEKIWRAPCNKSSLDQERLNSLIL